MRKISAPDWNAEGEDKFGPDRSMWRFVCPVCGNEQSGSDFIIYRRMGARPDTAFQSCIGKYNGKASDPSLPGCLFTTAAQPDAAPVEIEYGTGHTMRVMEFAEDGE